MSISAIKQAVKALEFAAGLISPITKGCQCQICLAHDALHQAIAEAEKQEPVAWIVDGEIKVRLDMAGKLYYSETNVYAAPVIAEAEKQEPAEIGNEWKPCVKLPIVVHVREQRKGETHVSTREGITPVKEDDLIMRGVAGEEYPIGRELFNRTYTFDTAPVHAIDISQERVDETAKCGRDWVEMQCPCGHKMYVKHTGREWVGLTPTDMEELSATWWKPNGDEMALIDWVETKLKEKNT